MSVDAVLSAARARISLLDPAAAAQRRDQGALFVDTRPVEQRRVHGVIPGAVVIDRNVLEWRLDPDGEHRHPDTVGHTGPIVVFCQQGYASSLAVASLLDIGVDDVHDLAGGFDAWVHAGLPVEAAAEPASAEPASVATGGAPS